MKTITANELEAKWLALLDEVAATGEPVTILQHGKPFAQLVPAHSVEETHPQKGLAGTVTFVGDIDSPTLPADEWDTVQGKLEPNDG